MTTPEPDRRRWDRSFLLLALLATAVLFVYMVRIFLVPVLLAAVFATLFYPFYRRLVVLLRGRRVVAALTACLILLIGLLVPMYLVGMLVAQQAVEVFQYVQDAVRAVAEDRDGNYLDQLRDAPWFNQLGLDRIDWPALLGDATGTAGRLVATIVNRTSRGTLTVLITLFVTLFTMFYFFLDGDALLRRLRQLSPLADRHDTTIVERFAAVARATIRGTLIIGLIQGALGTLTLWIFGVPQPLLWGVVMIVLSIVPLIGVKIVLVPAALFKLFGGEPWQGVGILIVTFVVILNVDNLLRPRLVGHEARMHDLMIFFSTIGGLATFGAAGFIIGPVIGAFLLALLEIYEVEFRRAREGRTTAPPANGPPAEAGAP